MEFVYGHNPSLILGIFLNFSYELEYGKNENTLGELLNLCVTSRESSRKRIIVAQHWLKKKKEISNLKPKGGTSKVRANEKPKGGASIMTKKIIKRGIANVT